MFIFKILTFLIPQGLALLCEKIFCALETAVPLLVDVTNYVTTKSERRTKREREITKGTFRVSGRDFSCWRSFEGKASNDEGDPQVASGEHKSIG